VHDVVETVDVAESDKAEDAEGSAVGEGSHTQQNTRWP